MGPPASVPSAAGITGVGTTRSCVFDLRLSEVHTLKRLSDTYVFDRILLGKNGYLRRGREVTGVL